MLVALDGEVISDTERTGALCRILPYPRLLRAEPLHLQLGQAEGHLVTLEFDHPVFEGAAGAGAGLEPLQQGARLGIWNVQPRDRRDQLAALARLGALHPHALLGPGHARAARGRRPLQAL